MADIAQLVSFVRNERARLAGFAMLDDVLTVIQDATLLVEQAEKQVKAHEAKLAGIQEAIDQANADHAIVQARQEAACQAIQSAHEAKLNEATDKALAEQASLKASIDLMEHNYAVALNDYEGTQKAIRALKAEKEDLQSDVTQLKKQLQDIKDSIK